MDADEIRNDVVKAAIAKVMLMQTLEQTLWLR